MADFEGDDQVKSLIFQSTRKNWKILLKWEVHQFLTKSHFQDMTFSLIFSRFMHFLTKNGCLWAWFWNLDFSIFLPDLSWIERVDQLLRKLNSWRRMSSPIFCHFCHFFAINGWFWGWYWILEFSIFQSTIGIYRFWLKRGINQLLTMRHSRDMVFAPFSAISATF